MAGSSSKTKADEPEARSDAKTDAPEAKSESDAPKTKEKVWAKYNGLAGIVSERKISKEDFAAIGVQAEDISFNVQNRFMVDVTDLAPDAINVLENEPDITFTTASNPRPVQVISVGESVAPSGPAQGYEASEASTAEAVGVMRTSSTTGSTGTGT